MLAEQSRSVSEMRHLEKTLPAVPPRALLDASIIDEGKSGVMTWILAAYLIIEYVRPQYFIPALGAFRPGLIIGTVLIVFSLTRGIDTIRSNRVVQLLIAFTVLVIVWVPFATNNFFAFNVARGMALHTFASVIPLITLIKNRRLLELLMSFWVGVIVYIAVFSMTHLGTGPGSFVADENDVALFLVTGLPFAYYAAQRNSLSKIQKLCMYAACAIIVLGIVATNSRGGFVGLAAVVAGLIWFSSYRIRSVLVILTLALCTIPFVPDTYVDEIRSISNTQDGSRLDRYHTWQMAWLMFKDNPVLGVGPGNYPWRVHDYERQTPVEDLLSLRGHGGRAAHSLYLTLLPELGLVGTLFFVSIVFLIISKCRKIGKESSDQFLQLQSRAVLVGTGGFLVCGVFLSVLYYPQIWFLAALATILLNQSIDARVRNGHRTTVT